MKAETLIEIGGNEWVKEDKRRIYFNKLDELLGLSCVRYNTGNIQRATLNGDVISNSQAREIYAVLATSKVWYDLKSESFNYKIGDCRMYKGEIMGEKIIEEILRRSDAVEANACVESM